MAGRIDPKLGNDTTICIQKPLVVGMKSEQEVHLAWSDSSVELPRRISEEGLYSLVTTLGECSTSTSIFVGVEDCRTQLFMPNIFSPNKDGINDSIFPLGNSFEMLQFAIFDRWGELVHNELSPWDGMFRGKASSSGVYSYSLRVINLRLSTEESYRGSFTLAR
jgi:gliding motility-associated-like protein